MSKIFINESTLTNIGNAIREKTGKTDLIAPGDMPAEIAAIEAGGGSIEVEPIVLTGDQSYGCRGGSLAERYIQIFPESISTNALTAINNMFVNYTGDTIPFEINCSKYTAMSMNGFMQYAENIKTPPKINNLQYKNGSYTFAYCQNIREFPKDYNENWTFNSGFATQTSVTAMFYNCTSLKEIPDFFQTFVRNSTAVATYGGLYNNAFTGCNNLRKALLIVRPITMTVNQFSYTFGSNFMLEEVKFEMNEDGTPIAATWSNQTLDLSGVGTDNDNIPTSKLINYNTGITPDKEVTDDASYQVLKNDPDWFNRARNTHYSWPYCKYNHDSAVVTINSLPDCSSGRSNVIKLKGSSGSSTDGGAISTLTEEEIAVATARGWTVTIS